MATFVGLWLTQRESLRQEVGAAVEVSELSSGGRATALGIAVTAIVLLIASGYGVDLGLPTFVAGVVTALAVLLLMRQPPWPMLKDISWEILPLVAGLFVLVEALNHSGVLSALVNLVAAATNRSATVATWGAGVTMAIVSNLVNNLPAGLLAGSAVYASHAPDHITSAVLIGVDLGPIFRSRGRWRRFCGWRRCGERICT